jgi:hypothetical protein
MFVEQFKGLLKPCLMSINPVVSVESQTPPTKQYSLFFNKKQGLLSQNKGGGNPLHLLSEGSIKTLVNIYFYLSLLIILSEDLDQAA